MSAAPAQSEIQAATAEHLRDIAHLAAIVWRASYPGIISPAQIEYMLARMYDLGVLRCELASGIRFERALIHGALRGFSSFGPGPDAGEIKLHKLYVHPETQRTGVGSALLASCEQQARGTGARALILNVNKQNRAAMAAYTKNGFTVRESVVVDIGNGFVMDDYIMAKPLR